jgi:hypothetical protein
MESGDNAILVRVDPRHIDGVKGCIDAELSRFTSAIGYFACV